MPFSHIARVLRAVTSIFIRGSFGPAAIMVAAGVASAKYQVNEPQTGVEVVEFTLQTSHPHQTGDLG